MDAITKIKHPLVVLARELTTAKGRVNNRKLLLWGTEQLAWAQRAGLTIEYILRTNQGDVFVPNVPEYLVTPGVMKKVTDTSYVVPVVAVAAAPEHVFKQRPLSILLENICDMGNRGTIVRSAQAFGIQNIIAVEQNDFFARKVIDSSRGTVFKANITHHSSTMQAIKALREQGCVIVATSPHAPQLQSQVSFDHEHPVVLALGNETDGLSSDLIQQADVVIKMPMARDVESLNVGVAAGISMYELQTKVIMSQLRKSIPLMVGRNVGAAHEFLKAALQKDLCTITSLSVEHVILLMKLAVEVSMTRKRMLAEINMNEQVVEEFLMPLTSQGFIGQDDAVGAYHILSPGEAFLAQVYPIIESGQDRALDAFTDDEKVELDRLLTKLIVGCQQIISE